MRAHTHMDVPCCGSSLQIPTRKPLGRKFLPFWCGRLVLAKEKLLFPFCTGFVFGGSGEHYNEIVLWAYGLYFIPVDTGFQSGSSENGAPRKWSFPDMFINQHTCRKSTVRGIFLTSLLFFFIFCLRPRPCLPARLQRAMQHQFDQTYGPLVFPHLKLPVVSKTLQGLRVEMGPQLEGKMRGPDQKHRCVSQHSLFMPAV